ncbi:3-deoxy-7-phosphoheptulonate synthase, partial [Streptomyces lavendulocolor]|uniref:3-deoxy-7-phosphoheptulonate synthase n=1 Tax=Streptomyces lavendulocolor TaxID=67316 RepID=UPI003408A26B
VGGGDEIFVDDLHQRYETACDPRLNRSQSPDRRFFVPTEEEVAKGAAKGVTRPDQAR